MSLPGLRLDADAWLERALVFMLAVSGLGLALALAGQFQAWLVLLLAVAATAAWQLRVAPGPASPLALRPAHVLAVLAVALLFRLPPYQVVQGGQDPGVYTNVAAELVRTGGIAAHDREWDRLAGSDALAEYRRQNYTDPFLPGVYSSEDARPALTFQFYHLLPVWLALAGSLFGLGASGYGLLLLSLLSILFFQRLAAQLSGSPRVGLVAGLMLAANPLHAFFSKYPVTEVAGLAFSAAAFCLLAMYAMAPAGERRPRWVWLSAAAMAGVFFNRISGFMYLPLLLAIAWGSLACDPDRARMRALNAWALAVVLAYLASVLYGLAWSRPYSLQIYEDSFAPLLGPDWRNALIVIGLVLAASWWAAWHLRERPAMARLAPVVRVLERLMGPGLLVVLAVGGWKAWQLGFTDHYLGKLTLTQFPGLVGSGWQSVAHASLAALAFYLGPLAFVALLVVAQRRLPAPGRVLLFLVCGFFAYAAVLNWVLPYQPYYGRYLANALLPYSLLLVCCALGWLQGRIARGLLATALAISGAGYLLASGSQVGKPENDGAYASIGAVAELAGAEDVILLDGMRGQGFEPKEVKTTLAYTFGRHVITIGANSLADMGFMQGVDRAYGRVFVLSTRGSLPPGYVELAPVRLWSRGFRRSALPPYRLEPTMDATLRVYRLERLAFGVGMSLDLAPDSASLSSLALPAGRYRLVMRGEGNGRDDARLAVVDAASGALLAQAPLAPRASPAGSLAWMDFEVGAGGARVALRMQAPAGGAARVRGYRITRLG